MAKKVRNEKDDERKARGRFVDQKGQWIDTTPASVKKRQDKAWAELHESLKAKKTKK